jgi:hypothetical protein
MIARKPRPARSGFLLLRVTAHQQAAEKLSAAVIPDAAKRRSGIHTPGVSAAFSTGAMDSGTRFARPE